MAGSRGIKKRSHEKLTDVNIQHVMKLLNAESPITKKEACSILNISYNTTRLGTIIEDFVEKKDYLQKKLREKLIETNQVHFRNDRYTIFNKFTKNKKFRNMDAVEEKYLVLPIHTKMTISDAHYVANTVNKILS